MAVISRPDGRGRRLLEGSPCGRYGCPVGPRGHVTILRWAARRADAPHGNATLTIFAGDACAARRAAQPAPADRDWGSGGTAIRCNGRSGGPGATDRAFPRPALLERIVAEAREVLCKLGVEIHNDRRSRCWAITAPRSIATRPRALPRGADRPRAGRGAGECGSTTSWATRRTTWRATASTSRPARRPSTSSTTRPARCAARHRRLRPTTSSSSSGLPHIAAQSTAFIPADVPEPIPDSYRLYPEPALRREAGGHRRLHDRVLRGHEGPAARVRGSAAQPARAKPLTIFSCCPTAPLKWSDVTSQNLLDCARAGIPVEFISMPLSGFMAPVTLVGSAGPAHRRDAERPRHQPARPPRRAGALRRLAGDLRRALRDDADGRDRDA